MKNQIKSKHRRNIRTAMVSSSHVSIIHVEKTFESEASPRQQTNANVTNRVESMVIIMIMLSQNHIALTDFQQ
jgi:hypothetical protein